MAQWQSDGTGLYWLELGFPAGRIGLQNGKGGWALNVGSLHLLKTHDLDEAKAKAEEWLRTGLKAALKMLVKADKE